MPGPGPAGRGTGPPAALYLEAQPPPHAVARRLRLRQGEPAITVTVMFEHPATGLPFALTIVVPRPALFRVAIETTTACHGPAAQPAGQETAGTRSA